MIGLIKFIFPKTIRNNMDNIQRKIQRMQEEAAKYTGGST